MFHYDRNIVAAAYRAEHSDKLDPKENTLVEFDTDLFNRYDAEIQKRAPGEGIPLDPFSRSWLVYYATRSTAKGVSTRVRHACAFFDSVRPQPTALATQAPPVVVPANDGGTS